jgi:hypothetical protein
LKWRLINDPFILSVQADGKLPLGNTVKVPPYGEGQVDAEIMAFITKSFEPMYVQLGGGFKYRFPAGTISLTNQIPYILDIGVFLPNIKNLGFDVAAYGYYPVGSGTSSSNLLSILPNITFKYLNYDFNLSFNKAIFGTNIDSGFAIQGGVSIKSSFEYPKVFNLLLLPKIDPEDLDKKELKNYETGKNLYINNCSKCHILINPDAFKMDKWEPVVDRYRDRKLISKSEHKAIIEFLSAYTAENISGSPETTQK